MHNRFLQLSIFFFIFNAESSSFDVNFRLESGHPLENFVAENRSKSNVYTSQLNQKKNNEKEIEKLNKEKTARNNFIPGRKRKIKKLQDANNAIDSVLTPQIATFTTTFNRSPNSSLVFGLAPFNPAEDFLNKAMKALDSASKRTASMNIEHLQKLVDYYNVTKNPQTPYVLVYEYVNQGSRIDVYPAIISGLDKRTVYRQDLKGSTQFNRMSNKALFSIKHSDIGGSNAWNSKTSAQGPRDILLKDSDAAVLFKSSNGNVFSTVSPERVFAHDDFQKSGVTTDPFHSH